MDELLRENWLKLREKTTGLVVLRNHTDSLKGEPACRHDYGHAAWHEVARQMLTPSIQHDEPYRAPDARFLLILAEFNNVLLSALDAYESAHGLKDPQRGPTDPHRNFMLQAISRPISSPRFGYQESVGSWAHIIVAYLDEHKEILQRPEATKHMMHGILDSMDALVLQDMRDDLLHRMRHEILNDHGWKLCSKALFRAERVSWAQWKTAFDASQRPTIREQSAESSLSSLAA